jgi:transcriptional regulator with XRE-family HTH domain
MTEPRITFASAVARNVRAERVFQKLTQVQLGERVGLSGGTISDIETGRRTLMADDLPLLCQGLGVPLAELARRADPADLRSLGF